MTKFKKCDIIYSNQGGLGYIMKKKRSIYRYLSQILFTSCFLIISTLFIFLPQRENYAGALSYLIGLGDVRLNPISEDLILDKAYPTDDIDGMSSNPYVFVLENTKNSSSKVQVIFKTVDDIDYVKNDTIKYYVDEISSEVKELDDEGIILTDTLDANEKKTYNLKFWLQEEKIDDILGKYFQATIEVKVIF